MFYTESFKIKIPSNNYFDITSKIEDIVRKSNIKNGICNVFSVGSTSGILLNENEPMLVKDIVESLNTSASKDKIYNHSDNAFSHIKSSIIGTSQTMPIKNGNLLRGHWQDVLLFNFDTSEREREVVITVMGE